MTDEELISKRELLRAARISYGTLYRWKRMNLIPESWFIHRATRTGQATFFPKERILARVGKIQELKSELSVDQLREIFSANVRSFLIPMNDFVKLNMVNRLTLTAFSAVFPKKEKLDFDDVFSMYVVDHLMRISGIYLEDAKQVIRMLEKYLSSKSSKEYQLILLRKMGIPLMMLVSGEDEILLEENTEIIACANLSEFEDALKDQLIS
ncbi:MAG: DUF4004 family protein [Clostridiaceae bacterium]|jgi:hypothetical protein|nr:DUF4004 family protein [Oscillospiraceae bacterium]NLO62761.1 DUF4004 family protein [Clostridiaceae bacterium]